MQKTYSYRRGPHAWQLHKNFMQDALFALSIFDGTSKVRHESQPRKSKFREVVTVFVIAPSRGSLLRENRLTKRKLVVVDASGQATYLSNEWTWLPLSPPR